MANTYKMDEKHEKFYFLPMIPARRMEYEHKVKQY